MVEMARGCDALMGTSIRNAPISKRIMQSSDRLRIVAAGFAFYAYGMVLSQSFNGAGDTRTPTWLNLIVFWLWEIPLAWALAVALGMGPRGAFVAVAIAFSTLAVAAGAIFRRGRWKRTVI